MRNPLVVHLVRHGEVYNPDNILYGRLPGFQLSETGRAQAAAVGRHLATLPLAACFTSPLARAQQTAHIALVHREATPLHTDERLIECLTPFEGKPLQELESIRFEIYARNSPPYETVADLRRRLLDFCADMRQQYPGRHVAAFTHGDVLVAGLLYAAGQPDNTIGRGALQALGLPVPYPATASILSLTFDDDVALPRWSYVWPYDTAQNASVT